MSGKTVMHTDVLSEEQKRVLPRLAKALLNLDFYLAGGTGLALQVGHPSSIDFDWFIPKLGDPEALFRLLKSRGIVFDVQSIGFETVYITVENVQISFIGYDYPLIQSKIRWPEQDIYIAGIDDIACMELSAIASRGLRKDFIDLHYMIKHFLRLEDYLKLYTKKCENRDIGHVVRSLVFFSDAEAEPEMMTNYAFSWKDLRRDFQRWVTKLSSK